MSGEAKHMGGPWRACHKGKCVCGLIWSVEADTPVAQVWRGNEEEGVEYPPEVVAANARLIEAAPALLKAARTVLAGLDARIQQADPAAVPLFDGIADLHDAIAKATEPLR